MKNPVYITTSGTLERHDNTLRYHNEKGKRFIPVETTSEIHAFGEIDLNTKLLNFLTKHEIPLHIYNYYGYWSGSYMPREHYVSGYLTLQQATHYSDQAQRLEIAKAFVQGSLANIEKILMYYNRRDKNLETALAQIRNSQAKLPEPNSIETLMALEGNARENYYSHWDTILANEDFQFQTRTKRPPLNRINALISFGNSLMYVTVLSEIFKTHLDARIGFLHTTNHRRYSLNLDIAEIFKPIIIDRIIFTMLNKNMLKASDFREGTQGIFLKDTARKSFLEAYDTRLKDTIQIPKLKRHVSYRRLIRMEMYKLEKHLLGDTPYTPYVARW
jgi:CRISP-associated protein Cas1